MTSRCETCGQQIRYAFVITDQGKVDPVTKDALVEAVEVLLDPVPTLDGEYVLRNLATGQADRLAPMAMPGAQHREHRCTTSALAE